MVRRICILAIAILCSFSLYAQAPKQIAVRAGKLIDGKGGQPIANALIVIEGGKIISVTAGGTPPAGADVMDLSRATVLPGFADVHTHILLNGDVTAQDYDDQLLKSRFRTAQFSRHAMRRLACSTASPRCATWKPKARCMPMWT